MAQHYLDNWRFELSQLRTLGRLICVNCGGPAACFGAYEDDETPSLACDECCGHGCEDGKCIPVEED